MQNQPSLELIALDMRNAKRQCKRPGRDIATPALMEELHRRKMMGKFFRNKELDAGPITRIQRELAEGRKIRPNMSQRALVALAHKSGRKLNSRSFL